MDASEVLKNFGMREVHIEGWVGGKDSVDVVEADRLSHWYK